MKKRFALPVILTVAMTALSAPVAANAETGYIRIGDRCYINIGGTGYPYLIPFPCPREVSENP